MEGENEVMDFDARTEAAMEAFSGPEETANAGTEEAERQAEGTQGQEDAEQPNAGEQKQEQAAGELTDEQRQADPQFQQLSAFKDEIDNTFAEFNIPDAKEAKLQLTDAQVLYQIARGEAAPAQLLDLFAQNWKPEQIQAVAENLKGWLMAKGFLKDGQAAAGPKQGEPGFKDPLAERLDKFENENKTRQQQEASQKEQQRREKVFTENFLPAVTNACKQSGVPEEDHNQYIDAIASKIKGNPAIVKRIEAGNYVDVKKFFAEVHNAEVKRLERYNAAQLKAHQNKLKNNPRIPSGGAPPAPAGSAKKANPRDRDSRIAAATEML